MSFSSTLKLSCLAWAFKELLCMLTLSLPSASYAWKEHDNNQDQIFLTLTFSFEIFLVITVAPLGIVCSCSTLRAHRSSALSFMTNRNLLDKHPFPASWAFTSGLNLMITVGKRNLPLLKKNAQLPWAYLHFPTYLPYQLQAPLVAQATWYFQ